MKKTLLTIFVAAAVSLSASAAEVSLLTDDSFFMNQADGAGIVPAVVNDGEIAVNIAPDPANAWDSQFFITAKEALTTGQKYTFSMDVKTTSPRKIDLQAHKQPGEYLYWNIAGGSVNATADWTTYTYSGEVPKDADGFSTIAMNLSSINEGGVIYFKNIKWDLIEEGETPDTPDTPDTPAGEVIVSNDFSKMDSYQMWKADGVDAKIENGALVVTNPTAAANFWDIQYMVADGFNVSNGVEYTITAKIKGFKGELHYVMGKWGTDAGAGSVTVAESADWQTVTIKITSAAEIDDNSTHLLFQTGDFAGTYSIESVVITAPKSASLDNVEVTPVVDHWTVYNLSGVKVLDTDNKLDLDMLNTGIYIINGKKVAIRR